VSSWERLIEWCRANAPATYTAIQQPAGLERLHQAQRRTGGWTWPEDVLDFYTNCDGTSRSPAGYLFPGFRPLSIDEVVSWWRDLVIIHIAGDEVRGKVEDLEHYLNQLVANPAPAQAAYYSSLAGTTTGQYIAQWLPVAEDQSSSFLVVDRRPRRGGQYGCVTAIDDVDMDAGEERWRNFDALLESTVAALEGGTAEQVSGLTANVHGGRLVWRR
jgi:cell wall assembly regulator SMI1